MNSLYYFQRIRERITDFVRTYRQYATYSRLFAFRFALLNQIYPWERFKHMELALKYQFLEKKYRHLTVCYQKEERVLGPNEGPVWVCWWQGEGKMPPIVKACYKALKNNIAKNKQIVLITEQNYQKYVIIPDYIIQKYKKGIISKTHFSDILRFNLLNQQGGLWLDATILTTSDCAEHVFDKPFFTLQAPYTEENISRGKWTGFCMSGSPSHPLFRFVSDLFNNYWKEYNQLIDYFLIDYAIAIGYQKIPVAKQDIDSYALKCNHDCHILSLGRVLYNSFSEDTLCKILDTYPFHKLSWKGSLAMNCDDGSPTFYSHIISM